MIVESIVTTVNDAGRVNIAPMGPVIDQMPPAERPELAQFVLRPFESSRTYDNLKANGKAVIHITDDVELFARAAVDKLDPQSTISRSRPLDDTLWHVLEDCHRWFAVTVESIAGRPPRFEMTCRVDRSEIVRPFFGFNRAKHAVIEAAILATRTHLISAETLQQDLHRLRPLIDKTAGPAERRAFEFLCETIDERFASQR